MLITTAIHLLVIGLNVSIDNATLDAYLGEKFIFCGIALNMKLILMGLN